MAVYAKKQSQPLPEHLPKGKFVCVSTTPPAVFMYCFDRVAGCWDTEHKLHNTYHQLPVVKHVEMPVPSKYLGIGSAYMFLHKIYYDIEGNKTILLNRQSHLVDPKDFTEVAEGLHPRPVLCVAL